MNYKSNNDNRTNKKLAIQRINGGLNYRLLKEQIITYDTRGINKIY